MAGKRIQLFISYAHADRAWKERLLKHLNAAFGFDPRVEVWDDQMIGTGESWQERIADAIRHSDAAVLLLSADFLASEFITRIEIPGLLEGQRTNGARLMPLLVRECPWQRRGWLESLQMRPAGGRNLSRLDDPEKELSDFAREIATLFDELLSEAPDDDITLPRLHGGHADKLAAELGEAYRQRNELLGSGADISDITERIKDLRREQRQGPNLLAGEFLADGRYQLIRNLGHGGFGTVWSARDIRRDKTVAIKVLHGHFSSSQERRERFCRGARQMAKLEHPHVVRVLGEPAMEEGWVYFVMEHLPRGDFSQAVLAGQLGLKERIDILSKIALALDFAHGRNVIHRDVKPDNIMITADGVPKLTDFDLVVADDTTGLTGTREGMGDYVFAAPEAMIQASEATSACDIYSLAATAVFALQGKTLTADFLIDRSDFLATLDIPKGARDVLAGALDRDPQRRPATATDLCSKLQAALDSSRSRTVAPSPLSSSKSRRDDSPLEQRNEKDGSILVFVPGGTYLVGDDQLRKVSRPERTIELSSFWISKYPITNQQYSRFVAATGHQEARFVQRDRFDDPDQPVVGVSWHDAKAYCGWAQLNLPTEAQWEAAARGAEGRRYPWGDKMPFLTPADYGAFARALPGSPSPVGSYPSGVGPFGTLDQAGCVWEWCEDVGDMDTGSFREDCRVARGGSWGDPERNLFAAVRIQIGKDHRYQYLGFRPAYWPNGWKGRLGLNSFQPVEEYIDVSML